MTALFVLDEDSKTLRLEALDEVLGQPLSMPIRQAWHQRAEASIRRAIGSFPGADPAAQEISPPSQTSRVSVAQRWVEFPHMPQRERGLVIHAGERLRLPVLTVPREPILWIRCLRAVPDISDDGLDVEIWCCCDNGDMKMLLTQRIDNSQPMASLRELIIDLPVSVGSVLHVEVRCGPGPQGDGADDLLGLLGLVVCERGELDLQRARTHHAWRLKNEIAHFSNIYSSDFYRDRHVDRSDGTDSSPPRPLPPRPDDIAAAIATRDALRSRLRDVQPMPNENAFSYACRMLGMVLPVKAPDFPGRVRAISSQQPERPLRMLALCAGEAAIEGSILAAAAVPVELCIVDVNSGLLDIAVKRMPATVTVDRVLGDANDIGLQLGQFDIVCITSGLHHLVELERVLAAIAEILLPSGEFWLIGEQVGRNGNRLWPEALEIANRIFTAWPAEKRKNNNSGKVDESIPDIDFSAGCFEGIRSQDIITQLDRHFLPVNCYLRNAFLWRLVDAAYAGNFNLEDQADRDLLIDAAAQEAMHWAQGGRNTEMHAVYRSKWAGVMGMATGHHAAV